MGQTMRRSGSMAWVPVRAYGVLSKTPSWKLRQIFNQLLAEGYLKTTPDSYMIVKTEEAEVRVNHSDIMYYETTARKIGIHLKNGEVLLVRKTIKELYKELNDEHFIKIHSGCVANAKYIGKYSNHDITLDNGEQLIVSRTRIKKCENDINELLG